MRVWLILGFLIACGSAHIQGASIDTLVVWSQSMQKDIHNIVVIPDNYTGDSTAYPVLYLLHGAGGDHTNWTSNVPHILQLADQYQMIIVCPDGGRTSWYFDSPLDPASQYETYVARELVGKVDAGYRTIDSPSARAITGLSMGGHGALYLALRHQDLWGAAGSMSGGLDIRPFHTSWDLPLRLGSIDAHPGNWEKHTVINMLHLLENARLSLMIDCGLGDFFYEVNRATHDKLKSMKYPHEYVERPGTHDWQYWSYAIDYQVLFFARFFAGKGS